MPFCIWWGQALNNLANNYKIVLEKLDKIRWDLKKGIIICWMPIMARHCAGQFT